LIFRIPLSRINWTTSSFLIGTFVLTLTAVPLYLWHFGIDWFHLAVFAVLLAATGFSITLGYHRLFSHMTLRAKLPVRLFTLIFGAAAFENSVLMWASDHRRHHKHVDHDEDPYDISKGFFHAHIGWLLFKLQAQPPFDNIADLKKDPLVMWQHRHIDLLAVMVSFVLPTLAGFVWDGWVGALGGFLFGGVVKAIEAQINERSASSAAGDDLLYPDAPARFATKSEELSPSWTGTVDERRRWMISNYSF
jgi:stearoyl-CoA desaturase (delta-9 desaturase)